MPKPKGGLGRGLNSLIPQQPTTEQQPSEQQRVKQSQAEAQPSAASTGSGLAMLPIDSISPNPHQPRQTFNDDALDELAASIREHGVLQPLIVTQTEKEGEYNLIAGERRWRASMLAGLDTVPVIVKEASTREMLELALVENVQRADLNPLEEAVAYKSLVDEFGLKQEDVATRVGKSRQAITNSLRLLRLPRAIQDSLLLELITEGHARAILQVPDEEQQLRLLERTVADELNVRQVEALAREMAGQPQPTQDERKPRRNNKPLYSEVEDLQERFRNALGTKVQLSRSSRGGKLVIYFYSDEELDRLYGSLVGEE